MSTTSLLVPDVGTLVEYGMNGFRTGPATYRVSGWMRVAPTPKFDPDDFLGEILFESCREFETGSGQARLQSCLREEATHLSLSGIAGAIAPIEQCKIIGRVNWPEEQIAEARESAIRRGKSHRMLF